MVNKQKKQATLQWEFNHSHFVDDQINKKYNCYICSACNRKMEIRNKPLCFYAHNGSKYDNNLFLSRSITSNKIYNFDFLAKSVDRFTQVTCMINGNNKDKNFKISFCDSLMMIASSLDKVSKMFVSKANDHQIIKTLAELFYNQPVPENVLDLCYNKAVFQYKSLCDENQYNKTKYTKKTQFYSFLSREKINDKDYQSYRKSDDVLKNFIGKKYDFIDYHNYYLLLDVVLLATSLYNFSKNNM